MFSRLTTYLPTLCLTRVPCPPPIFWNEFCQLLGTLVGISSGFHPQSNGLTECKNLRNHYIAYPSSRSKHLLWIEYAYNTLSSSATFYAISSHLWVPAPRFHPKKRRLAFSPIKALFVIATGPGYKLGTLIRASQPTQPSTCPSSSPSRPAPGLEPCFH